MSTQAYRRLFNKKEAYHTGSRCGGRLFLLSVHHIGGELAPLLEGLFLLGLPDLNDHIFPALADILTGKSSVLVGTLAVLECFLSNLGHFSTRHEVLQRK